MNAPDMTPTEAADIAEPLFGGPDGRKHWQRAIRVLIDHARATSPAPEGSDLAEAAGLVDTIARRPEMNPHNANLLRLASAQVRAHRCAPAPSAAAPPQEDGEDPCVCGHRRENHGRIDGIACCLMCTTGTGGCRGFVAAAQGEGLLADAMWAWHDRWIERADEMLAHHRERSNATCRTRWVDYERRAGEVAVVLRVRGYEQPEESVLAEQRIRERWRNPATSAAQAAPQTEGGDRRSTVLADREAELLAAKGPCRAQPCRLHFAHRGPCDTRSPAPSAGIAPQEDGEDRGCSSCGHDLADHVDHGDGRGAGCMAFVTSDIRGGADECGCPGPSRADYPAAAQAEDEALAAQDRRAAGSLAAAYRRGYRDGMGDDRDPNEGHPVIVPDDLAVPSASTPGDRERLVAAFETTECVRGDRDDEWHAPDTPEAERMADVALRALAVPGVTS